MMKHKLNHTSKAGMKRKIDLIESKTNKINAEVKMKAPLKADLIIKLKDFQEKFEILEGKIK